MTDPAAFDPDLEQPPFEPIDLIAMETAAHLHEPEDLDLMASLQLMLQDACGSSGFVFLNRNLLFVTELEQPECVVGVAVSSGTIWVYDEDGATSLDLSNPNSLRAIVSIVQRSLAASIYRGAEAAAKENSTRLSRKLKSLCAPCVATIRWAWERRPWKSSKSLASSPDS